MTDSREHAHHVADESSDYLVTHDDEHEMHHEHQPPEHVHEMEHQHHEHDHDHDSEPVDYADAVEAFRRDKDEFFKTGARSPVPVDQRATFEGIPYFPVDEALRFEDLTLQPYTGSEPRTSRSRPRTGSSGRRIGRGRSSSSSAASPAT